MTGPAGTVLGCRWGEQSWGSRDLSDFYVEDGTVDDRSGVSCQD